MLVLMSCPFIHFPDYAILLYYLVAGYVASPRVKLLLPVYSSRSRPTLRRFVPCSSTDVALTREFPDVLVLLLLLGPVLRWLLALALLLWWTEVADY